MGWRRIEGIESGHHKLRHYRADDNEIDSSLLVEASGVTVRADLIIVGRSKATTSMLLSGIEH